MARRGGPSVLRPPPPEASCLRNSRGRCCRNREVSLRHSSSNAAASPEENTDQTPPVDSLASGGRCKGEPQASKAETAVKAESGGMGMYGGGQVYLAISGSMCS